MPEELVERAVARAIGGESWSGPGRIWYAALTDGAYVANRFRIVQSRRHV